MNVNKILGYMICRLNICYLLYYAEKSNQNDPIIVLLLKISNLFYPINNKNINNIGVTGSQCAYKAYTLFTMRLGYVIRVHYILQSNKA